MGSQSALIPVTSPSCQPFQTGLNLELNEISTGLDPLLCKRNALKRSSLELQFAQLSKSAALRSEGLVASTPQKTEYFSSRKASFLIRQCWSRVNCLLTRINSFCQITHDLRQLMHYVMIAEGKRIPKDMLLTTCPDKKYKYYCTQFRAALHF